MRNFDIVKYRVRDSGECIDVCEYNGALDIDEDIRIGSMMCYNCEYNHMFDSDFRIVGCGLKHNNKRIIYE